MLSEKINEIKNSLTNSQFKLAISIFDEDVEFHKSYRENSDKELCEVLGQAANIAKRF